MIPAGTGAVNKATLCLTAFLPWARGVFGLKAAAETAAEPYTLIYIRGSTTIYKFGEDGSKTAVYDDGDYIVSVLTQAMPMLASARVSGDYTAYAQKVLELMRPAYDGFRPSLTDGSVPEDTRVDWYWTPPDRTGEL